MFYREFIFTIHYYKYVKIDIALIKIYYLYKRPKEMEYAQAWCLRRICQGKDLNLLIYDFLYDNKTVTSSKGAIWVKKPII